jgi:hypothetical protein
VDILAQGDVEGAGVVPGLGVGHAQGEPVVELLPGDALPLGERVLAGELGVERVKGLGPREVLIVALVAQRVEPVHAGGEGQAQAEHRDAALNASGEEQTDRRQGARRKRLVVTLLRGMGHSVGRDGCLCGRKRFRGADALTDRPGGDPRRRRKRAPAPENSGIMAHSARAPHLCRAAAGRVISAEMPVEKETSSSGWARARAIRMPRERGGPPCAAPGK